MTRSLNGKINALSKNRQITIQNRANELIADEMMLRDLRQALKNADGLKCSLTYKQDGVSRIENRSDMLLSDYV